MHVMKLSYIFILPLIFTSMNLIAEEMIIGEESYGDYQIIFEAAPKDQVYSHPSVENLKESETDIHIEALITWNNKINIEGQLPGSHIPYLDVTAHIINLRTKKKTSLVYYHTSILLMAFIMQEILSCLVSIMINTQ